MLLSERPQTVVALRQELDLDNDVIGAWMKDTGATRNPYCVHTKDEVYDSYSKWAKTEGRQMLESVVFWRNFWGRPQMRQNRAGLEFQHGGARKLRFALTNDEDLRHQSPADEVTLFD